MHKYYNYFIFLDAAKPTTSNEEISTDVPSTPKSDAPSDSVSNKNETVIKPENE